MWPRQSVGASLTCARDRADDPALRIDQPDHMIFGVDDEHVARGIECHLLRRIEHCVSCVVVVACVATRAGAGDGLDDAVAHAAQAAALPFQNVDGIVWRQCDGASAEDVRRRGRTAVTGVAIVAGSGKCGQGAGGKLDDMNPMIGDVSDE